MRLSTFGIKLRFGRLIVEVARPADEICHRAHRPVAVENLDTQPAWRHVTCNVGKGIRGLTGEQTMRRLIAVDRPAGEIMRSGIAHLDDQPRHHRCRIDERRRPILGEQALRCARQERAPRIARSERRTDGFRRSYPLPGIRVCAVAHSPPAILPFAAHCCGHAETHSPSTVFCESTVGIPAISALVRTVPV